MYSSPEIACILETCTALQGFYRLMIKIGIWAMCLTLTTFHHPPHSTAFLQAPSHQQSGQIETSETGSPCNIFISFITAFTVTGYAAQKCTTQLLAPKSFFKDLFKYNNKIINSNNYKTAQCAFKATFHTWARIFTREIFKANLLTNMQLIKN